MIKKLDTLIIRSFIGPFTVTFFITFFVLMMQTLWKYIDDLVGKDLDLFTIGQFLWYASASLLTLAMPIAILISSIMTFGNLGESFELVAIKSAGISLLRFMQPLIWVAILLCGITFLFANYVIPFANLKFKTIYYDIAYKKPALDLKPGTFYKHIPGYAIKIGKKDADGKTIHNVVIYEQQSQLQDNSIIAEKGVMKLSADKKYLEFTLQNGHRYQERGSVMDTSTEFIRMGFTEYKKLFDITALQMMNTSDTVFKNDYKMLSIRLLDRTLDSLKKEKDSLTKKLYSDVALQFNYLNLPDSIWKKTKPDTSKSVSFLALFPDSIKNKVYDNAVSIAYNIKNSYQLSGTEMENKTGGIKVGLIEWHRKFSLSLACLVLFFIGAPLGSIIRKGGLGMPLVVAILFFLIFHLLNMFGEKFVKEDIATPFTGMWLSVLVLTPLGIFLTYKAMHDSALFNKEFYYRFFKNIRPFFKPIVNKAGRKK
ncbi:MAG: LptF/LptG family permease [Ferruginibacter sp.]|nr:LptF/LptG family permease [Ferruginibacter sp.]